MADPDQKARDLMAEAEKKLSGGKGFFSSMFGSGSKEEDAIDSYQRAANLFKMSKNWNEAGNAFSKAAALHQKLGNRHDAATNFSDASNCYKKSNPREAIACLLKAIEIQTDMGRFTMAAKSHQTIAEIYETELSDMENSMKHYEQENFGGGPGPLGPPPKYASGCGAWDCPPHSAQTARGHGSMGPTGLSFTSRKPRHLAADYFQGEESNASANKCLLNVAQQAALIKNYEKAISIYEKVASSALDSSLLKYSAKDYFFRAALCRLCSGSEAAESAQETAMALKNYEGQYPAFQDSRECKLIKAIIAALEDQSLEQFVNKVQEYDSISRLDPWHTKLLNRIKEQLDEEENLK